MITHDDVYKMLCFRGVWFLFLGVPVVSLESAERPNYFLAVSGDGHLQMEHWSQVAEFSRRATFIQHQGLFLPGRSSFELVGQQGIFLTLTHTLARAKRYDNTDGFKISSSFALEGQALRHRHKWLQKSWVTRWCSSDLREQFCHPTPYHVRVALPGLCKPLCPHLQWPRCGTLPVSPSVRTLALP